MSAPDPVGTPDRQFEYSWEGTPAMTPVGEERGSDHTVVRQYAAQEPDKEPIAYGDQSYVKYGDVLGDRPDGSRIVHRDIRLSYEPWIVQATGERALPAECADAPFHAGDLLSGVPGPNLPGAIAKDAKGEYWVWVPQLEGFVSCRDLSPGFPMYSWTSWSTMQHPVTLVADWLDLHEEVDDDENAEETPTEAAPVWKVGQVVTAEMGEPPVGSEVEDGEGECWKHAARDFFPWIIPGRESNSSWENLIRVWSPLTLVSLPDAQPDDPKPILEPKPTPQPQTRKVPLSEARIGDAVVLRGIVSGRSGDGDTFVEFRNSDTVDFRFNTSGMSDDDITVVRDVRPLPTTPGTVGTATVRGVKGVRVMRTGDDEFRDGCHWLSSRMIRDRDGWADSDLADFVELLPGESA